VQTDKLDQPFSSIESAINFMQVLAETILETRKELDQELKLAMSAGQERRARGIALALFKLKTLNGHVYRSRRVLNDLRMLRRVILNERITLEQLIATM
jgi:hypothetical protein